MPLRHTFTAPMRGISGPRDDEDWERVLSGEASATFRVAQALDVLGPVGRLLGGRALRTMPASSVAQREARLEAVRHEPIPRKVEALRRRVRSRRGDGAATAQPAAPVPVPSPAETAGPAVGPYTSAQVDDALELLRAIPFEELQRRGWHLQPNHFYWPLNDVGFLRSHPELWHGRGVPRDIDWDVEGQLATARRVGELARELEDAPEHLPAGRPEFAWVNNSFSGADAVAYYGLVRSRQPRRVVEIGSGWSSLVLARALARNDTPCEVTIVEPYPNEEVWAGLPSDWTVHEALLQFADPAVFEALGAGDVLFYDGSHCVRTGSDVNWLFFEVLPRLAPGVLVHVHDMFWPDDYHDSWILDEGLSWNEQYLVQAFLMGNRDYRVVLANHLLHALHRDELAQLYPRRAVDGGSLWIEKS